MVWAWSRGRILDVLPPGGREPRRILPETVCRGVPRTDGCELVALDEGFEGRIWEASALKASACWGEVPSLAEWNQFRRGGGLDAAAGVPAPFEYPLSPGAWRGRERPGISVDLSRHRALLVPLMAGALALALAAPLGSGLRLLGERGRLERAIRVQEGLVSEILAAREAAERDAAVVDDLMRLRPPAGQIRVLSAVLKALPPSAWELLEWRVPEPSRLEAVLRMAAPDARAMVGNLEASPVLDAVSVDVGRRPDEVVIKATIIAPVAAARSPTEQRP